MWRISRFRQTELEMRQQSHLANAATSICSRQNTIVPFRNSTLSALTVCTTKPTSMTHTRSRISASILLFPIINRPLQLEVAGGGIEPISRGVPLLPARCQSRHRSPSPAIYRGYRHGVGPVHSLSAVRKHWRQQPRGVGRNRTGLSQGLFPGKGATPAATPFPSLFRRVLVKNWLTNQENKRDAAAWQSYCIAEVHLQRNRPACRWSDRSPTRFKGVSCIVSFCDYTG